MQAKAKTAQAERQGEERSKDGQLDAIEYESGKEQRSQLVQIVTLRSQRQRCSCGQLNGTSGTRQYHSLRLDRYLVYPRLL